MPHVYGLDPTGERYADRAAGKHLTTLAFSEKGSRSQFWAPVSTMTEAGFSPEQASTLSQLHTPNFM